MASLDTTCFDGVVGLASCACPCIEELAPTGWDAANSGLYVNDLLPLDMAEGSDRCNDPQNPWNLLSNSLEQAKIMLANDVKAGLMKRNQLTRKPFTGMIGEKASRNALTLSKPYAGVRIMANKVKGGYYRLTSIGGVFAATGTVSVQIYDRFNAAIGSPISISTTAGQWAETACNVKLPLWVDGAEYAQYFLLYSVNQNNIPRAIKPYCPPCNRGTTPPIFSVEAPHYQKGWTGALGWANWIMVGGFEADNITDFDLLADEVFTSEYTNGLTITGELYCDPITSVCLSELNYSDPVALSLAHALRYMAAIIAAEKIIRNPAPYRNSQVSREILATDIQQWWKDYEANVNYATYNAELTNSDCIFCKPAFSMSIQSKLP